MNDPHVKSLVYRVKTRKEYSYVDAKPVHRDFSGYSVTLADNVLTIEFKDHYATEDEAITSATNLLNAWQLNTLLEKGPGWLEFEYDRAEVIDRSPTPGAMAGTAHFRISMGTATVSATSSVYPEPPDAMTVNPLVKEIWIRHARYADGKEPIGSYSYWILSRLQDDAAKARSSKSVRPRDQMAAMYGIAVDVIDKWSSLSSDTGSPSESRKIDGKSTHRPFSTNEWNWLEHVTKLFIRRAAEYADNPQRTFQQLTLADLPPL